MDTTLDGRTYAALSDAWSNADYGKGAYHKVDGGDAGDEENGGHLVGGNLRETLQGFGRHGAGMSAADAAEMATRLVELGLISVRPFQRTMKSGRVIRELYTITRDGQIALKMRVR